MYIYILVYMCGEGGIEIDKEGKYLCNKYFCRLDSEKYTAEMLFHQILHGSSQCT